MNNNYYRAQYVQSNKYSVCVAGHITLEYTISVFVYQIHIAINSIAGKPEIKTYVVRHLIGAYDLDMNLNFCSKLIFKFTHIKFNCMPGHLYQFKSRIK